MANRTLERGDIFFGGEDSDVLGDRNSSGDVNYGTFYGGPADDVISGDNYGTFYGEADGGGYDYIRGRNFGTFNGDAGDDFAPVNRGGTVNGGDGNDSVTNNGFDVSPGAIFYGDAGNDYVETNYGTFYGGAD